MTGYAFALSCLKCGARVEHVTGNQAAGTQACAVARCMPSPATERKRRWRQGRAA